jgi:hypothetical protein
MLCTCNFLLIFVSPIGSFQQNNKQNLPCIDITHKPVPIHTAGSTVFVQKLTIMFGEYGS